MQGKITKEDLRVGDEFESRSHTEKIIEMGSDFITLKCTLNKISLSRRGEVEKRIGKRLEFFLEWINYDLVRPPERLKQTVIDPGRQKRREELKEKCERLLKKVRATPERS